MTTPSKQNPNSSLPNRMQDAISIPEFNDRMSKLNKEAERLAFRANRIWKIANPDDNIDTGLFDKKDFIQGTELVIPKQAQELFDYDDNQRLNKVKENENQIRQSIEEKIEASEEKETSVEELQSQLGYKQSSSKETFKEENTKKHPLLAKLKEKFGIKEEEKAYLSKVINDVKITFEFPTALTTNFAMAIATGEGIGTLDFANSYELARCAMSIVALDDVPVSELFAQIKNFTYDKIPTKVRKLCGFEVMQFLQKMQQKELENILSFFRTEIGFEEITSESEDIVELECMSCHTTKTVPIDEKGNYDIRYCDRCGNKLVPTNTTQTDGNVPLA